MPVAFADFAQFEQRMLHPTFVERRVDEDTVRELRRRYAQHAGGEGRPANFSRPMHVRLLRKAR
jgi:hypothetical protein